MADNQVVAGLKQQRQRLESVLKGEEVDREMHLASVRKCDKHIAEKRAEIAEVDTALAAIEEARMKREKQREVEQ